MGVRKVSLRRWSCHASHFSCLCPGKVITLSFLPFLNIHLLSQDSQADLIHTLLWPSGTFEPASRVPLLSKAYQIKEGGGSARDEGNQPWSHHFKDSLATVEEPKLHGQMLTRNSTGGSVIWAEGRGSGDCYSIISLGVSELKTIQKVDSKTSSK